MIFPASKDILQPMKKEFFVIFIGVFLSSFTFGQTNRGSSDPLAAYLNEEEDRENNQTPEEKFQEYVSSVILERQAFRQGLSSMLGFLKSIEENKVRRSDVNRLKQKLEDATALLSENDFAFVDKEDAIFESLEKCVVTTPEETPAQ